MSFLTRDFFISKRADPIRGLDAFIVRFYIIVLGLIIVGLLLVVSQVNPFDAYGQIIRFAWFTKTGITQTLLNFIPLLLIGLGIAIPARAQIDNIGAEGQLIIGSIGGFLVARSFPDLPPVILVSLMFMIGFTFGAIWAIPIALFRAKGGFRGADVVVSFLLVFPADFLLIFLVTGPWESSAGRGFPQTDEISANAQIGTFTNSDIHVTLILAFILTLVLFFFIYQTSGGLPRTKIGYEINVAGNNLTAARTAGLSYFKIAMITIIISGGLAGIAGVGEMAGNPNNHLLRPSISVGLGFTGIAVAWLGGLKPSGILFSAFLFAGLQAGNLPLQLYFGLPKTTVNLLNGAFLFIVLTSQFFIHYKIRRRSK